MNRPGRLHALSAAIRHRSAKIRQSAGGGRPRSFRLPGGNRSRWRLRGRQRILVEGLRGAAPYPSDRSGGSSPLRDAVRAAISRSNSARRAFGLSLEESIAGVDGGDELQPLEIKPKTVEIFSGTSCDRFDGSVLYGLLGALEKLATFGRRPITAEVAEKSCRERGAQHLPADPGSLAPRSLMRPKTRSERINGGNHEGH